MERSNPSSSRRGAGLLSLVLFLLACLGPHLPFLHADHHQAAVPGIGEPSQQGDRALSETQGDVHECFLCLWKNHRDGNAWEGAQPAAHAFHPSPAPAFPDTDGSASRGLIASAPARAPPALA